MSARPRYTPLRHDSHSEPKAELDAAFNLSDDENEDEETELTPLTHDDSPIDSHRTTPALFRPSVSIPTPTPTPASTTKPNFTSAPAPAIGTGTGTYDFERDYEYDYDFPPPGSPPGPSTTARPNDYGNSNGLIPSSPVAPQPWPSKSTHPSLLRRAIAALWPRSQYARVPADVEAEAPGPAPVGATRHSTPRGGGIDNDGVFANVMAKPARAVEVRGESGEVYMVPEESQREMPPSYNEAQTDAVPSYWETTVHAPHPLDANADMIVDDLPTGSVVIFVWTTFISYFFSFVGFALTYLLHASHAAKYGSRAGLGITLIQYGFFARMPMVSSGESGGDASVSAGMGGGTGNGTGEIVFYNLTSGLSVVINKADVNAVLATANGTLLEWGEVGQFNISSRDWLSLLFMTLGWFLLLSSLVSFYRVKRWEYSIRGASASASSAPTPEPTRTVQNPWFNPLSISLNSLSAPARAAADEPDTEPPAPESLRRDAEVRARIHELLGFPGAAQRSRMAEEDARHVR